MTMFPDSYQLPGMRAADFTREAAVAWGKEEQRVTMDAVIAAATVYNNGATNETNLPGGLLLGGPVSGKVKQWDPTDVAGYQRLFGVLMHDQRMLNAAGTATDRFNAPILVGGLVKPSELYATGYAKGLNGRAVEMAARAALTQTGRFIMDDELYGNPYGGWLGIPVAKTADYTVLEADNNVMFTNLAATDRVRFTLPDVAMGYRFGFFEAAGVGIDIVAASGTPIIGDGDATRDEVSVPPEIGTFVEVIGIQGTSAAQYIVKITPAGVGAAGGGTLASDRYRLSWTAGARGKPSINADIQNAAEGTRMIADPDFEVAGTNASSDDVTFYAEGGVTFETDGAGNDQVLMSPHVDANQSAWRQVTWGTDRETAWECRIRTGAAITNLAIVAGLKLTNTPTIATDANQVAFFYRTDHATITANWIAVNSIANVDVEDDTGIALAINTDYHLKITIDAGRVARFYINGQLVATSAALTDAIDLVPQIGLEDLAAAARTLHVRGQDISRNAA